MSCRAAFERATFPKDASDVSLSNNSVSPCFFFLSFFLQSRSSKTRKFFIRRPELTTSLRYSVRCTNDARKGGKTETENARCRCRNLPWLLHGLSIGPTRRVTCFVCTSLGVVSWHSRITSRGQKRILAEK